jgi:hypothetical protein
VKRIVKYIIFSRIDFILQDSETKLAKFYKKIKDNEACKKMITAHKKTPAAQAKIFENEIYEKAILESLKNLSISQKINLAQNLKDLSMLVVADAFLKLGTIYGIKQIKHRKVEKLKFWAPIVLCIPNEWVKALELESLESIHISNSVVNNYLSDIFTELVKMGESDSNMLGKFVE